MINISKFSKDVFDESKDFTPLDPLGEELKGIKLWVRSSKSEEPSKIVEKTANELNKRQFESHRTGKLKNMTFEQIEARDIDLACSVLTNFTGISTDDGELVYNEENKRKLMSEYEWLRSQVLEKANSVDFFTRAKRRA